MSEGVQKAIRVSQAATILGDAFSALVDACHTTLTIFLVASTARHMMEEC